MRRHDQARQSDHESSRDAARLHPARRLCVLNPTALGPLLQHADVPCRRASVLVKYPESDPKHFPPHRPAYLPPQCASSLARSISRGFTPTDSLVPRSNRSPRMASLRQAPHRRRPSAFAVGLVLFRFVRGPAAEQCGLDVGPRAALSGRAPAIGALRRRPPSLSLSLPPAVCDR